MNEDNDPLGIAGMWTRDPGSCGLTAFFCLVAVAGIIIPVTGFVCYTILRLHGLSW